jgi:hypothetical protein
MVTLGESFYRFAATQTGGICQLTKLLSQIQRGILWSTAVRRGRGRIEN